MLKTRIALVALFFVPAVSFGGSADWWQNSTGAAKGGQVTLTYGRTNTGNLSAAYNGLGVRQGTSTLTVTKNPTIGDSRPYRNLINLPPTVIQGGGGGNGWSFLYADRAPGVE